ncbi:MAG: PH domain-containing protein [Actinobacteria bacterium]|nr:PH domain-containing protein [Actinomycetota bacterium]
MAREELLAEGEERVLLLHPHWKMLLRPCLLLVVVAAAALALLAVIPASRYAGPVRAAVGAAAVLALITWCAMPYLRWRTTTYELTTRRLRLRTGILSRSGRDFPLTRISDVSFSRGPVDRLLGCGRLVVESPGEHGQLVLTGIPRVAFVQSTLFQLAEDEQARLAREDRP